MSVKQTFYSKRAFHACNSRKIKPHICTIDTSLKTFYAGLDSNVYESMSFKLASIISTRYQFE